MLISYAELKNTMVWWLPPMRRMSYMVYWSIVALCVTGILILFCTQVDIAVRAPGIVRPVNEKTELKSLVSGLIDSIFYQEGDFIQKNEILFTIHDPALSEKKKICTNEINIRQIFLHDLNLLINTRQISKDILGYLSSPLYRQEVTRYLFRKHEQQLNISKSAHETNINASLAKDKVISSKEFYDINMQQQKIFAVYNIFCHEQYAAWQEDIVKYQNEVWELISREKELDRQFESNRIRVPVSGFLQDINTHYAGSPIQAGEVICSLSPAGKIIAECYVSTKDIGMVKAGQPVRFLIDAFDYNYFGMATGRIYSIDNDCTQVEKTFVFKVRCLMDQKQLFLRNGYRGEIKKGMVLQARFLIGKRTPWQLIFDKVDNWLNPAR
jgi:membrane fusion protein, peptide pheromone/bacteriocin exporter